MRIPASKLTSRVLAVTAGVLLAACSRKDDHILARVGDQVLTEEVFRAEAIRRSVSSPEAKRVLLDQMVRDLKLMQLALERGYDQDPEIRREYRSMLIGRAKQDFGVGAESDEAIEMRDVQAYYDTHGQEFAVPARVRASMIFVATPAGMSSEARAEKRAKIEEARADIQSTAADTETAFGAIAVQCSEDQATRYAGGDIGYQVEGLANFSDDNAAQEALFALHEVGALSGIVEGRTGFFLFKLIERTGSSVQPIEAVRDRIRVTLRAGRRAEKERGFHAALAAMPSETRLDQLAKITLPVARIADASRETPPPLPGNGRPAIHSNDIP